MAFAIALLFGGLALFAFAQAGPGPGGGGLFAACLAAGLGALLRHLRRMRAFKQRLPGWQEQPDRRGR